MRIAIIGTGATGSVYAALLAAAGLDVWAVDKRADHMEAIRRDGLHISGASPTRTVRMQATTEAGDVGQADLVVIATKAADVEDAARSAAAILKPDGVVLPIQNGLGSAERVAAIVGADRMLHGVIGGFGASIPEPGTVHHNGMEFVRLGELGGGLTPRLERVADLWRAGGFKVLVFEDIGRMVWEKLICNVAFSGSCTLTGLTIGEVAASPDAWPVALACGTEAWEVARAKRIAVAIEEPAPYLQAFAGKIPGARPSMLLDFQARRRSEIDVINGAIPREAEAVGLSAPVNTVVTRLVRAAEAGFAA